MEDERFAAKKSFYDIGMVRTSTIYLLMCFGESKVQILVHSSFSSVTIRRFHYLLSVVNTVNKSQYYLSKSSIQVYNNLSKSEIDGKRQKEGETNKVERKMEGFE